MIRTIIDFLTGGDPTWDTTTGHIGYVLSIVLTAIHDLILTLVR